MPSYAIPRVLLEKMLKYYITILWRYLINFISIIICNPNIFAIEVKPVQPGVEAENSNIDVPSNGLN